MSEDTPSLAPYFTSTKELTAGHVRDHKREQWSSTLLPITSFQPFPLPPCCTLSNFNPFQVSASLYAYSRTCLPSTPRRGIRSHATKGNKWSLLTSSTNRELLVQAKVQHTARSLQSPVLYLGRLLFRSHQDGLIVSLSSTKKQN